jgi:glycolate oxidase
MPYGDDKHNQIFGALCDVLGAANVSDSPSVMKAYSRDMFALSTLRRKRGPEFVVLPGNTEDVRQIIILANRYKFPYSIMSTGWMFPMLGSVKPYWLMIDFKRMNKVTVDEKNMYALIEPYVTHAMLHAEAIKRGLHNGNPSVGGQFSALANHAWHGWHCTAYRTGFSTRNILGMEWVLPNGELLRTGSLALPGDKWFWAEGPGPDLKNLRKGIVSENGSLGVITRMAVKLHPWPGPKQLPTEGVAPGKKCVLPADKFRWFFINYPNEKDMVEAMYLIGKAEIAGMMQRYPAQVLAWEYAKSREEYWKLFDEGLWLKHCNNMLAVCLWGWTSPRQLDYEETVLKQIATETGGSFIPQEIYDKFVPVLANTMTRAAFGPRWCRIGGSMQTSFLQCDSLDGMLEIQPDVWAIVHKYTPPYLEHHGDGAWILPMDFCHHAGSDTAIPHEKEEEICKGVVKESMDTIALDIRKSRPSFSLAIAPANFVGPNFANYHIPLSKIKRALDPNNLANPTRFIDIDQMDKDAAKAAAASSNPPPPTPPAK